MAPHHRGDVHQSRDGGSDSIYNHPAIIFGGLFLLCFFIMAPMLWMLWMMRKDTLEEINVEERLNRIRNWKHIVAEERQQRQQQQQQQQQTTQPPIGQDVGQKVKGLVDKIRLSKASQKLHEATKSIHRAVALQSQLLWGRVSQQFTNINGAAPRRNRSQSRAGVSIELPIMRQPAWQKLASGSASVTPSITVGDLPKPTSAEIETTSTAGPSGLCQASHSGSQMLQGSQGQYGVIEVGETTGAELRQPLAATTVGLALG